MFRISMIVDAKKLAPALVALDGMGYNLEVVPVKNAEPKQGKVREAGEITAPEIMRAYLKQWPAANILTQDMATGVNLPYSRVMWAIRALTKDGTLIKLARCTFAIDRSKL